MKLLLLRLHLYSKSYSFSNFLSHQTVISKNIIPKPISNVNISMSNILLGNEIVEPINATANQAAEMLLESVDNARNHAREFFIIFSFYCSLCFCIVFLPFFVWFTKTTYRFSSDHIIPIYYVR